VNRYRMRPRVVDAMQFDGSRSGVERVVAWMQTVAPDCPVRPRTEYSGWDDLTGHLELEIKGMEMGCMASDWIVVTNVDGQDSVWSIDDASFRKYYEELPD
jgi:hypothetical protein